MSSDMSSDTSDWSPVDDEIEFEERVIKDESSDIIETTQIKTEPDVEYVLSSNNNSVITLENDDDIKKFLQDNPKLLNVSANPNKEMITEDDEIWLMQCSQNIDISILEGLSIFQEGKQAIKIPKTKYECVFFKKDNSQKIHLLQSVPNVTNCKFSTHAVKGKIIVREKLHASQNIVIEEENNSNVPFPDNLKVRHPLFGADFESKIELSPTVKEQLQIVNEMKLKLNKKSKKKRKLSDSVEYNNAKRIKRESIWETEKAIEECLFDSPVKKKKKKKKD